MRLLVVLLVLFPSPLQAGPWPRAKGEIYVFSGHEGGRDGWSGLYAEYGGPLNLTFGLDAGGHVMGLPALMSTGISDLPVDGRVRAFVRIPILAAGNADRPEWLAPWLVALDLGLGADWLEDGTREPRGSAGISIGRGLSTRFGDGWTTVDLGASFGPEATTRLGLQAVAGLRATNRITLEMGLFAEAQDSVSVVLAPTLQYGLGRLGDARIGFSLDDTGETSLRVGYAQTF